MDVRKSKVEASAIVPGVGGKNIGPGQHVDLDEAVGGGHKVRDLFPAEWFEAPEAPEGKQHQAGDEPAEHEKD